MSDEQKSLKPPFCLDLKQTSGIRSNLVCFINKHGWGMRLLSQKEAVWLCRRLTNKHAMSSFTHNCQLYKLLKIFVYNGILRPPPPNSVIISCSKSLIIVPMKMCTQKYSRSWSLWPEKCTKELKSNTDLKNDRNSEKYVSSVVR